MELPTSSPLIRRALKGVERSHVAAGTPKRVRRPISWDVLLGGQGLASLWGPGGRVLWMSLALGYSFVARSDGVLASATRVVHPVHCSKGRDVALYCGGQRLMSFFFCFFFILRRMGKNKALARCSGTRLLTPRFVFEVIKVTRPNRGRLSCAHATASGGHCPGWERAAVLSLSWWSCCRVIRHCRKAPPCRRIGLVTG